MKLIACVFFSITLSEFLACSIRGGKEMEYWRCVGEESPNTELLAYAGAE